MPHRGRAALTPHRPTPPPAIEWPRAVRHANPLVRFGHVELELDVEQEGYRPEPFSLLEPLTSLLHEREVESAEDLLQMSAQVLRALSDAGFRQVDHWEARPGGWLPLPEPTHARLVEPVTHLLRALSDESWAPVGKAHTFAVRLSGPDRLRIDLVVRRVHRERKHAVSLELWGPVRRSVVIELVARIHRGLPLVRAEVLAAVVTPLSAARPRAT